ncbi:MAG: hypothetical protein K1X92_04260 [Bacteroidia bacterium]|nr:hypothetical protein [Bacteroidia bacterium]
MKKFKNKYRIASHRNPHWDYSADALYFLTIVTQNRECNLGKIINTESLVVLSDFGKIVECEWFKSFEIRRELILHEFVIMPNHLHAIVEIYNENRGETVFDETTVVETHGRVSLPNETDPNEFDPELPSIKRNPPVRLPKSISSFMAGFKSAVNTKIDDYIDEHHLPIPKYNKNNHFFQPNYHDHIIRNEMEYKIISRYIINNPKKWNKDRLND